ncbi:hypothetical protein Q9Q94_13255 [Uliginosibacterium sp. 31-16]|nr:hypothetical protein [Uliginosibacterium sp. 31-16]MDP5240505.1 hypothetical protein [Uliginosibacterium sp. 31-16]
MMVKPLCEMLKKVCRVEAGAERLATIVCLDAGSKMPDAADAKQG